MALKGLNKSRQIKWIQIIEDMFSFTRCENEKSPRYAHVHRISHSLRVYHISVFALKSVEIISGCWNVSTVCTRVECFFLFSFFFVYLIRVWVRIFFFSPVHRRKLNRGTRTKFVTASLRHHYNCPTCYCFCCCCCFFFAAFFFSILICSGGFFFRSFFRSCRVVVLFSFVIPPQLEILATIVAW